MYSDNWHREECRFEELERVAGNIFWRHVYSGERLVGVMVDYEYADDFHYELEVKEWKRFVDLYLGGKDDLNSFQNFITSENNLFLFEYALKDANIEYNKIAFY